MSQVVAECVLSGNTSVDRASLVSFLHSLEDRAGTVQYSTDRIYSVEESCWLGIWGDGDFARDIAICEISDTPSRCNDK